MKYSKLLGAVVCDQRSVDSGTIAKIKALLDKENLFGFKYLFVSLADDLLLDDDLVELGQWADLMGRCRRAGLPFADLQGAVDRLAGQRDRTPSLAGISKAQHLGEGEREEGSDSRPARVRTPSVAAKPSRPAVSVAPFKVLLGRLTPGTKVKAHRDKDLGKIVSVRGGAALVRWPDGQQRQVTLRTLADKRRYSIAA